MNTTDANANLEACAEALRAASRLMQSARAVADQARARLAEARKAASEAAEAATGDPDDFTDACDVCGAMREGPGFMQPCPNGPHSLREIYDR